MSRRELHDLLLELKHERAQFDLVGHEQHQRLDSIIESLEQQKLYPEDFDQYSTLGSQINELVLDYEKDHPTLATALNSVAQILRNFQT